MGGENERTRHAKVDIEETTDRTSTETKLDMVPLGKIANESKQADQKQNSEEVSRRQKDSRLEGITLAWPSLQSLAVKKTFIFCKFWAVKNF